MSNLRLVQLLNPIQMTITGTFTPRGAYNAGTDYAVGDMVSYSGSSYIMYNDGPAGTTPTNTSYWGLVASIGATGATGATGAQGPGGVINQVKNSGTNVTQRGNLNFKNGLQAVDDGSATTDASPVYGTGANTVAQGNDTRIVNAAQTTANLSDLASIVAARTNLGLGSAALLASDTDTALTANSDSRIATQKATKTYIDALIGANDAMVYKGVIDASTNPNYPAADAGHTYKISVAGKIGGASGPNVEVGDAIICTVDGSSAGTQAGVGANWTILQVNVDGAVTGPASSTTDDFATFNGASGKVIKDSGISLDTNTSLGTSDVKVPSQKAVKTYADLKAAKASNLSDMASAATSFDNIKQNATSSYKGVLKLAGDLGGTSDLPTVPGLIPTQISTLTTAGHSWTGASDTQAYYLANFGYTGIVARTLGLLGIHENNHTHLGVGASYLTRTNSVFGAPNAGWGGFMQFIIPYSHPLQGDAATLADATLPITQPSSFQLVHHINDLAIMGTGVTTTGLTFITTAFQNALRAVISRARAGTLYSSYYNSSGTITWDTSVITGVSGFTSTGQTGANTGVAVYRSTANGNTLTLTLPANFTGGYFAVQFLANTQAQTLNTTAMNNSDVATVITVSGGGYTDFAVNDVVQMYSGGVASGELMLVTAIVGTTFTLTRGYNSTSKTTHANGDEMYKRNDAAINFSGTASAASGSLDVGSIALPSQAIGGHKVPAVKRFNLTAADAGKTIICTVANIITGATNTQVDFDSAWIESADPQPFVVQNTPIYGFAGGYSAVTQAQYLSFNTAMASITAEFTDGACQIADVATPMWKRAGTLNANITSAGGINFTITANDPTTFATFPNNSTFCVEGERLRPATITNNGDGTFTLNNCSRGEAGTTAASHTSGKVCSEGSWMSKDGIHPSGYGAAVLAQIMYNTFQNCTRSTSYTLANAGGSSSLDMRANNLGLYNQSYLTLPTNVQTNAAGVASTMYAHAIYIPQVCIIQSIGAVVTTLNASSTLRFGLYGLDTSRSHPQYLIKEFGTVGGTATGFRSVTANHVVRPGWYFLAVVDQGTVCSKRCIGASGLNFPYMSTLSAPGTGYAPISGYSVTGVSGSLPNTWSGWTEITTALIPLIFIQVRSKHMG